MPKVDTLQQTIGKFIKNNRKKQKMTQATLALLSLGNDCYATKIGKIEKGLINEYSIVTLSKILKALGFEFSQLFKE